MSSNFERLRHLVGLRRLKAEHEAGQISRGIAAGQGLRESLMRSNCSAGPFADMTLGYVTRTIGILDRGLAVLVEQRGEAQRRIERLKETDRILDAKAEATRAAHERKEGEREIQNVLAARRPPD